MNGSTMQPWILGLCGGATLRIRTGKGLEVGYLGPRESYLVHALLLTLIIKPPPSLRHYNTYDHGGKIMRKRVKSLIMIPSSPSYARPATLWFHTCLAAWALWERGMICFTAQNHIPTPILPSYRPCISSVPGSMMQNYRFLSNPVSLFVFRGSFSTSYPLMPHE